MGVDFYPCAYCGEVYADCGDYVQCDQCGKCFCSEECADARWDEDHDSWEGCRYCRGDEATLDELLDYAIEQLNKDITNPGRKITFESLKEEYLNEKRSDIKDNGLD